MFARTRVALCLSFALVGCRFDSTVSDTVPIHCTADNECRVGEKCLNAFCAIPTVPDSRPVAVVSGSVRSQLLPRFGNPLTTPTALGPLVELELNFALTREPLAPPISVGTNGVNCTALGTTVLRCSPSTASLDGTADVALQLLQPDGTSTTTTLITDVPLRVTPPTLTPTDTNAPKHVRQSFGVARGTTVTSGPGLVDPSLTVVVVDRGVELLRVRPDADGGVRANFPRQDVLSAELSAIDVAGNRSAPLRVRRTTWVGTLEQTVRDSNFPNPMRASLYSVAPEGLEGVDGLGAQAVEADGLGAVDGVGPTAVGQPLVRLAGSPPIEAFTARSVASAMAWDEHRATLRGTDYSFDGRTWTKEVVRDVEGDGSPISFRFAWYDPRHHRLLGYDSATVWAKRSESWERLSVPLALNALTFFDRTSRTAWFCGGSLGDGGVQRGCVGLDDSLVRHELGVDWPALPKGPVAYDERRNVAYFTGAGPNDGGIVGLRLQLADAGVEPWPAVGESDWAVVEPRTGPVLLGPTGLVDGGFMPRALVLLDGGVQALRDDSRVNGWVSVTPRGDVFVHAAAVSRIPLDDPSATIVVNADRLVDRGTCNQTQCVGLVRRFSGATLVDFTGPQVTPIAFDSPIVSPGGMAWSDAAQAFVASDNASAAFRFVSLDGGEWAAAFDAGGLGLTSPSAVAAHGAGWVLGTQSGLAVLPSGAAASPASSQVERWTSASTWDGGSVWLGEQASFCGECSSTAYDLVTAGGPSPWPVGSLGLPLAVSIAFDPSLGRPWVVGATTGVNLWVESGTGWAPQVFVTRGDAPSRRPVSDPWVGAPWTAYSPSERVTHVFADGAAVADIEYGTLRPAVVVTAPVELLQRQPTELLEVVRVRVRGRVTAGDGAAVNLTAQLFVDSRWAPVLQTSALGAPELVFEARGSAALEDQLARTGTIAFRLQPSGTNGTVAASLFLDDVVVEADWASP